MARTIKDKADALVAAVAARRQAEAAELAAINALGTPEAPGDESLREGECVFYHADNAVYALIGGNVTKLAMRGVIIPPESAPLPAGFPVPPVPAH